ncbi:hypothetical protein F9C11_28155 [Amycolatopsis sp. VS8301801F10]|uniref:hypothetical protein n=1 Tax=Amycolatopsis sp. VS8301801F10 TaxID=2652442 RepID=UPI0038FC91F2
MAVLLVSGTSGAGLLGGELGLGRLDGGGTSSGLLMVGERAADGGQARILPLRAPVRMISSGRISSTGLPFALAQHVPGDRRGPSAVVSLAGGGVRAFEGGAADVLAVGFRLSRRRTRTVHLVDGKDDAAMRGVGFDLAAPSRPGRWRWSRHREGANTCARRHT